MRPLIILVASCGFVASLPADVDLDAIFGPDITPEEVLIVETDEPAAWAPPPPLVLPPALDPLQLRQLDEALRSLDVAPPLASLYRAALAAGIEGEVLASNGLTVLCPPVMRGRPLESLKRWLAIMAAAEITELPAYAHGSPAWVMWRQLSANPLTTDAEWVRFYRALGTG